MRLRALAVIRRLADDMEADPEWQALILHSREILGVEQSHLVHFATAWITNIHRLNSGSSARVQVRVQ